MKLTYRNLLNAQPVLKSLMQLSPAPLSRLIAQIARNIRLISAALQDFDTAHKAMLKPYLDKDGAINIEELEPDIRDKLNQEFSDLLSMEIDVDIHPLKWAHIAESENAKPGFELPQALFYVAWWFIEEESTEEETNQ